MCQLWKTCSASLTLHVLCLVLTGLCFTTNPLTGQTTKYFENLFPTPFPYFEDGWTVNTLIDGYLVGCSKISSSIDSDIHYFKTDFYGNKIWDVWIPDSLTNRTFFSSIVVDDGYILAGYDQSLVTGKFGTFLLKTDTSSNVIWQKTIGDTLLDNFVRCISKTNDGGFILAGHITMPDLTWEAYLIKTDSAANVIWTKQYNGPNDDELKSVKQLADSSFILTGYTNYALGSGSVRFIKTDSLGNMTFDTSYTFLGNNTQIGWDVSESLDGGFIIGGTTGSAGVTKRGLIFKTDFSGNIMYAKVLSEFSDGSGAWYGSNIYKFIELSDSTIIGVGSLRLVSAVPPPYVHQLLLLKLDSQCNEIWRRLYSPNLQGYTYGLGFDVTPDGGFVMSCRSESPNNADVFLVKTNCLGYTSAPQAHFSSLVNGTTATFTNLSQYSDTCIYFFGDGDSLMITYLDTLPVSHTYATQGWFDPYMIAYACGETDTLLLPLYSGVDEIHEQIENSFSVFPNPVFNTVTVSYNIPESVKSVTLELADIKGRILHSHTLDIKSNKIEIDLYAYEQGVYQIILQPDGVKDLVRKLVKLK